MAKVGARPITYHPAMSAKSPSKAVVWTGVGGLPFDDRKTALDHVVRAYPRMPFIPQLPGDDPDAGMLVEVLPPLDRAAHAGYGVKLDAIGADPSVLDAFDPAGIASTRLLTELDRSLESLPELDPDAVLKFQLAGPVTLLQTVRDFGSIPLWVYPDLHARVADWLAALAVEAGRRLLERHEPVCVWLDEPVSGLPGVAEAEKETTAMHLRIFEELRELGIGTGLHCCSAPPFDILTRLPLDYLSFDLLRYEAEAMAAAPALMAAMMSGMKLVIGVISSLIDGEDEYPGDALRRLARELEVGAGSGEDSLADNFLLSPTCGALLAPVEREIEMASRLAEWSNRLASEID